VLIKGIIHKEFAPEKKDCQNEYHLEVPQCLLARMKNMRLDMEHLDCWLLHYNMPTHEISNIRIFLAQKMTAMLNHPPHSTILVPEDFFLHPKLKLRLKKFTNLI
jgi:hypothetical protein